MKQSRRSIPTVVVLGSAVKTRLAAIATKLHVTAGKASVVAVPK